MLKRILIYPIVFIAVAFLTLHFGDISLVPNKAERKTLLQLAEQGDVTAQYRLSLSLKSQGNLNEAYKWLQKSAEQGYSKAQNNIAVYYYNGDVVQQDYKQAIKWYEKASAQKNAVALNSLALMYQDGLGVQQDELKAISLLEQSAALGNVAALVNLAQAYKNGRGVSKDEKKAHQLFFDAASGGQVDAQHYMGVYFYKEAKETGELAKYKAARAWLTKAAEQGSRKAQVLLGAYILANSPIESPETLMEAGKWLAEAANQNSGYAKKVIQESRGRCVDSSEGADAGSCYLALHSGHKHAMYVVALAYDRGTNLPIDKKQAEYWYRKAARSGNPEAQVGFAIFLDMQGKDEIKDIEAYAWFVTALTYPNLAKDHVDGAVLGIEHIPKDLGFLARRSAKNLAEKFTELYGYRGE